MNKTPPWPPSDVGDVRELMRGNEDAVSMLFMLSSISHVYDDIVDGDKPDEERVHRMMWQLLFDLPLNRFYAQHEATLRPVIITGILNWIAANQMEKVGEVEELRIAHAIRYSICDVGLLCMYLLGGRDYAMTHARRWRLMSQYDTWDNYLSEHSNAADPQPAGA